MVLKGASDLPTEALEPTFTPEPTATPEPTDTPLPEGTDEPQADTASGSNTPPPEQAETAPPTQQALTQAPTRTPLPTATPTPAPRVFAAESKVYYTTTGVNYHSSPRCGTMTQGREHTVAEALAAGKNRCPFCGPVPESYADENAWLVWLDERNCWHLTSDCAQIQGESSEMLFTDLPAQDGILISCPLCGAQQYEGELPEEVRSRAQDPGRITNGDALVYFNEQDAYYHAANKCQSNAQMTFTAHKLSEAVTAGKQPCPHCRPAEASFN
ncbi:MAG: hypothetical protein PUK86_09335 [bacterium]|nr:hypothetical protein [bacterium]